MLNKIPVLDKGHVALVSCSLPRQQFKEMQTHYFRNQVNNLMLSVPHIHMEIRCPLFVQLSLAERLTCVSRPSAVEAFTPSVNEVGAKDLETSELISRDIEQTTEALLMNPKAYQMDGCDIFISQVISPISVYNTVLVSGTLGQWIDYANLKGLPAPIEEYRKAVQQVLLSEYDYLWEIIGGKKKEKEAGKRNRKGIQNKN